jgi:hypothetical protein
MAELNREVLMEIFSTRFDREMFEPIARATAQS